jgi:hypothetical protein
MSARPGCRLRIAGYLFGIPRASIDQNVAIRGQRGVMP